METVLLAGLKKKLHARCLELLQGKIAAIIRMQTDLLEGAADDSKSSAGDKHETARAMMQLEQEKLAGQLQEVEAQWAQASRFVPDLHDGIVRQGSLVMTDRMNLYLLVGLGKVSLDGSEFFVLSPASPLGRQLLNLRAGELCTFNSVDYRIANVV